MRSHLGFRSLLGKSLDKDSDYCSINLPSNCELVVVQNGERVRHLALRYEAYSVNKVAESERPFPFCCDTFTYIFFPLCFLTFLPLASKVNFDFCFKVDDHFCTFSA